MRAFVDRIEDGRTAVITLEAGGEIFLPAKNAGFKLREGMWLSVEIKPDAAAGREELERIKKLQSGLLAKRGKARR